jgi:hypothetical protein
MKKTLLTLALVGLSAAATYAQGTIQFQNSALSKVKYQADVGGPIVDAPTGTKIGLFWGTDAGGAAGVEGKGRGTLSLPTTQISATAGVFLGGLVYPVSGGTDAGQRIWMKIAGWDASAGDNFAQSPHYGESAVVNVLLGPTPGPGSVIFQSAAGTATDRVKPFTITIPEPSVVALGALGLGALLLRRRKTA